MSPVIFSIFEDLFSAMLYQCAGTVFTYIFPQVSKAKTKITVVKAVTSATENMYLENGRVLLYEAAI